MSTSIHSIVRRFGSVVLMAVVANAPVLGQTQTRPAPFTSARVANGQLIITLPAHSVIVLELR